MFETALLVAGAVSIVSMRKGTLFIALAFTGLLAVVAACFLPRQITVQDLLREASKEAQQIRGEGRERAFVAILGRQTKQGFTADALDTVRRYGRLGQSFEVADFAGTFADNGDVQNARKIVEGSPDPASRIAGLQAIAVAQAGRGDVPGARATAATLPDRNAVDEAICRYQIRSGDFEGALATAKAMPKADGVNMLFVLGESSEPPEREDLRKLARYINTHGKDHRQQKDEKWPWFKQWAHHFLAGGSCCDGLARDSVSSASACEGPREINLSGEPWAIALDAYLLGDLSKAEQQLTDHPKDMALAAGLIIEQATKRGDIANALRFADLVARLNPEDPLQWKPISASAIGNAWARKDKPATVVRWARSRPTSYERAMALLGVAEAIADSAS